MEKIVWDNDLVVFCVQARSFPEGVLEAHQKLHTLIPFSKERRYFGISRPESGKIAYKAAAEEMVEGEGSKLNCETVVLKRGTYVAETLFDFMKDTSVIGRTFEALLAEPGIDPQGYCVELYLSNKDVTCMVRLAK